MKYLQKQLGDIKKEKEKEIQDRNEMIAHLKDQLQEMKAKTNMEGKYSKKCTEVRVAQTQKRCTIEEKNMKDDIDVSIDTENVLLLGAFLRRTSRKDAYIVLTPSNPTFIQ